MAIAGQTSCEDVGKLLYCAEGAQKAVGEAPRTGTCLSQCGAHIKATFGCQVLDARCCPALMHL